MGSPCSEYLHLNELETEKKRPKGTQFAMMEFGKTPDGKDTTIICPKNSLIIGSKLDKEITTSDCR